MELKKEEVAHVATLARLELTDEEVATYQTDLSRVLAYIGEMQQLDLKEVEPTAQVTGMTNRLRDDEPKETSEAERTKLLDAFPDREDDQLKVKQVFG